jgi:dolichol-phosphate mannosyltransferase
MGNVQRFLRFGLVGGSGVVVNMGVLYLLTTVGGIHPIVAAILGTEAAIVSNFVLNDHWTFRDALPAATCHARFLRYNVFALGGMLLSVTTLATLTYGFGLHYLLANLAAIGAATLWNYIANARWTWTLPCADPLSSASGDA